MRILKISVLSMVVFANAFGMKQDASWDATRHGAEQPENQGPSRMGLNFMAVDEGESDAATWSGKMFTKGILNELKKRKTFDRKISDILRKAVETCFDMDLSFKDGRAFNSIIRPLMGALHMHKFQHVMEFLDSVIFSTYRYWADELFPNYYAASAQAINELNSPSPELSIEYSQEDFGSQNIQDESDGLDDWDYI